MSDLISRSELIDYFYYGIDDKPIIDGISDRKIIDIIKNQPTAYSVDKVVEELEKELEVGNIAIDYGEFRLFEIVKQGGVTKNCNNCANYTEHDEVDNGCYLCCKGYEDNYEPKVDNGGVSDDVCKWTQSGDMAINPHTFSKYKIKQCDGLYALSTCPYCRKKIKMVE